MVGTDLTPIKVPGKNRRDQRRSIIAANRKTRPKPPGRPPKVSVSQISRDSAPTSTESHRSANRRSLKNLKSRRNMADLEKLPIEILTPIFLFSMNLCLPNASPIISGKLSDRLTIVEAITNAFNPTWEYCYSLIKNHCESQRQVPGDPKLQSAILRCRCATLSILRQAEAAWLHRMVLFRGAEPSNPSGACVWHRPIILHGHDATNSRGNLSISRMREIVPNDSFAKPCTCSWHHKAADDYFVEDWAEFSNISDERTVNNKSYNLIPQWTWTSFLHVHPRVDIPETLLQGPWTTDMVEYLFWLIRAGARIHWKDSTNGEVALLGLKNAISTGNVQILHIFQYLGLGRFLTPQIVEWSTEHAGGDKVEIISRLMRILYGGVEARGGDLALVHIEVAGALDRMLLLAQRKGDRGQDIVEAIAVVTTLKDYWNFLSDKRDIGMAKY